jgi:hypothetical protein
VSAELEAIMVVGRALARLQSPAGRRRVLHWAAERFDAPAAIVEEVGTIASAPMALASDPSLAVDDLGDLFDDRRDAALRGADGIDDPLGTMFEPAAFEDLAPCDREVAVASRRGIRVRVVVHFFVNALRRFTLAARSPEPIG